MPWYLANIKFRTSSSWNSRRSHDLQWTTFDASNFYGEGRFLHNLTDWIGMFYYIARSRNSTWSYLLWMSTFGASQEERDNLLRDLAGRKQCKEKLLVELEKYKACDPEVMELMKQQTLTAKDAANRWTGNTILLLKFRYSYLSVFSLFHLLITTFSSVFLFTWHYHLSLASLIFSIIIASWPCSYFLIPDLLNPLFSNHPSQHSRFYSF